jgi:Leucine-rich repeat (LRR) protein
MGSQISKEISYHKDAKEFDLSKHGLKEIPAEIKKCRQLEKLDLSENEISDIPADLSACTSQLCSGF